MAAAAVMLSYQTAGKAARDALFLSNFPAQKLPSMVMGAALLSILLGLVFGRLLERKGPGHIVPRAFLLSGILQFVEFAAFEYSPHFVAPLIYLHIVGLGAILLSGFWSFLSEQITPRDAKQVYGKIAGMGTVGGIVGGLIAERCGAWFGMHAVLAQLGVTHILCAGLLWYATRFFREEPAALTQRAPVSPWETFSRIPYLGALALLVLLGTSSAAVIDYLFKAQAREIVGTGPSLLRFFAIFHTGSAILTFILQSFVARVSFEKLGLTRTVGSLPAIVGAGSLASLAFPFFPITLTTRLAELVVRGSVFRSGYELFYIPIPAREKRGVKSLIDVACDRMGDAVGSAIVQTALVAVPGAVRNVILGITAISAGVSLWIASRLDAAYQDVVKHGLMDRADQLDLAYVEDVSTLSAVLNTVSSFVIPQSKLPETKASPAESGAVTTTDPIVEQLCELRSGDAERVQHALGRMQHADALLAPQIIRLMAWNEVTLPARRLLLQDADKHVGLLVDFLLDESQDFAVRRRIPRVLAATKSQRGLDGLMQALEDARFEVRFQCGRALDYLHRNAPEIRLDPERIYAAVERELSVNRTIWDGRRLLDRRDSQDEFSYLDEVIKERAHQSLEHVFSLLSIVLPRDPLKIAFRALHSDDRMFRGLALEYVDNVLPPRLRNRLAAVITDAEVPVTEEARQNALAKLMASNDQLVLEWQRRRDEASPGVAGNA